MVDGNVSEAVYEYSMVVVIEERRSVNAMNEERTRLNRL